MKLSHYYSVRIRRYIWKPEVTIDIVLSIPYMENAGTLEIFKCQLDRDMTTKYSIYVNMQVSVTSSAEEFCLAEILVEGYPQS